jgi:hypothetical protein
MSSALFEKKLQGLIAQQGILLDSPLEGSPMLRGSFSQVHTCCGKANCWCARTGKGHPHARITWSQQGKLITRKVPSDYIERVRQLTASYRRFRSLRRRLMEIFDSLKLVLASYEEVLSERTRETMPFLTSASSPLSRRPSRRPNRRAKNRRKRPQHVD